MYLPVKPTFRSAGGSDSFVALVLQAFGPSGTTNLNEVYQQIYPENSGVTPLWSHPTSANRQDMINCRAIFRIILSGCIF